MQILRFYSVGQKSGEGSQRRDKKMDCASFFVHKIDDSLIYEGCNSGTIEKFEIEPLNAPKGLHRGQNSNWAKTTL